MTSEDTYLRTESDRGRISIRLAVFYILAAFALGGVITSILVDRTPQVVYVKEKPWRPH